MYEPRVYRHSFNTGRFATFTLQYRETDLWIGIDHASFCREMADSLTGEVAGLWKRLEDYMQLHRGFLTSHKPVDVLPGAPDEVVMMAEAALRADTGPMAAVAGMFAWHAGEFLREKFPVKEVVVENGGDFYLYLQQDITMTIYAGKSPLSEKIAVVIPAARSPLGVCTSSGTVGHSFSYGKADAVMVACRSPLLADAWATSLANRIQTSADISQVLEFSEKIPEIESIVIICEDKAGIRGNFDTRFIKK